MYVILLEKSRPDESYMTVTVLRSFRQLIEGDTDSAIVSAGRNNAIIGPNQKVMALDPHLNYHGQRRIQRRRAGRAPPV